MSAPLPEPARILLVEDDPADVELTREGLKAGKLANEVVHAEDGEEALEMLRGWVDTPADLPDIILLDLNMPRMDGMEFLDAIKKDHALKHIPVIVLTTSAANTDVLESYRRHASAFMSKPVDFAKFTKLIHEFAEYWFMMVKLPHPQ